MSERVRMPLLDVMVCTTCELRCVGCTNHIGGLDRLELFPVREVNADVDAAARVIHAEVAVMLGGEPLQHPAILQLLRHAKRSGLADRVRVLTNGIRLHRMRDEFWEELDDLKISVYPGRTPPENVQLARDRQRDHGFQLSFYEVARDPFRAVLTSEPRGDDDAQAVYDRCWYRHNTRKVERGHFYRCCTSPAISKTVLGLPPDRDGVPLVGLTVEKLREFLGRPAFMESCRRCHGNLGPGLRWREQRDRELWRAESAVAA